MIIRRNILDEPILNACENIWKVATYQGDDYTSHCNWLPLFQK